MALKLDFSKLGKSTQEDIEASDRAYRERRDALILERTGKVEALIAAEGMTGWEQKFVHDMHYFATTFDDIDGLLGGRLATLSEKQVQTLARIHRAHAASAIPSPGM
jgi:hypothetical protein